MKALIKVGYACNNHCSFCHTLNVREIDDTKLGVHQKIERAAELGYTMAVLSGGEPTMRPELMTWATHAAKRELDFGLVTNGRMLAYPKLVDRLMDRRLKYVYMSLHGGTAKVHNAMVRAHAFEDTIGAVRTLSGRGLDLTVNCVVANVNVDKLIPLVDLLLPFDDVVLKFSMVEPKGAADKLFDAVIPKVSYVAERVLEAVAYGQERTTGLKFAHDGIPLCLLPGLEGLYDDLKTHGFASMTEVYEPDFYPVDNGNCEKTDRCIGCGLSGPCVGLYKGYNAEFDDSELRPVPRLRSNSYNYVYERDIAWPAGENCPVFETGITPFDKGRHVFVRQENSMAQYRTYSRDFSDLEIQNIKRESGQIYLDISSKDAPDDFSRDLKKLNLLDNCSSCALISDCAGCYSVVPENVFESDDRVVAQLLQELSGNVLDVGCGESRYGHIIEPLVATGNVTYTGVEPDVELVERYRTAHPWAQVVMSPIETFALEDDAYDHILVLRSFNHIKDPRQTLKEFSRALKIGGTLLIVDNVAFGLVRTSEQATRGEGGKAEFEHYRNDNATQALEYVDKQHFTVREIQEVGPSTSNQWYILLEKMIWSPKDVDEQ